jgi:O-antigen/teichoic acid export membrane protein
MRLGQTSVILSASKFIGSGLGFISTVYFARKLGESVLGQYALVLTLVAWFNLVGKFGLSKALTKRISEGEDQEAFLGAGILTLGTMFTLALIGVLIVRTSVERYVGAEVAEIVIFLSGLGLAGTLMSSVLQGKHLVHISGIISMVERTIRTVSQVALVVVGFGLTGLLFGYAVSSFVAILLGLFYIDFAPSLPGREHIASLFEFAKYAWLGSVSNKTFDSIDIAVLGLFVSSGLIGIYSVAWSIAMFLNIFGRAITSTLFPEISKNDATDDLNTVRELTKESLQYSGLITLPGLVGVIVIGDRLMRVYGSSFEKGTAVLTILIGAALIYGYVRQLRSTLNAINRPELAFRVNAVFVGTNTVLNVTLIWQFGWVGAAVATLLSALVGWGLAYRYVRLNVGIAFPLLSVGRQVVAALTMGGLVFALRRLLEANWDPQSNAVFVSLLVSTGAVVYFGVLGAIWPAFRLTVVNNLPMERLPE